MSPTGVMGVLNVTPDSFYDGGRFFDVRTAVEQARRMAGDGAGVIDVGGESTRPGAAEVSVADEIARTTPVIERIAALGPRVSIDTRKAAVAAAAIDAGATIVNDVSGGTFDPAMAPLVADRGVDVVLMHMRGTPSTMDGLCDYGDVVADVGRELEARAAAAVAAGVAAGRILVDPGLGFAKTHDQSLEVLRRVGEFGRPLVVGPSRKRFVGAATGANVGDRLAGTLACVAWCAMHSVAWVRVHDVAEARRTIDMIGAITGPRRLDPTRWTRV